MTINPNALHALKHGQQQLDADGTFVGVSRQALEEVLANIPNKGVYLHVFHGRDSIDQEMDDWGFDGPVIGPLNYVHTTYGSEVKFGCSREVAEKFFTAEEVYSFEHETDGRIILVEGLLPLGGKFYGDWSVFGHDCVKVGENGELVAL